MNRPDFFRPAELTEDEERILVLELQGLDQLADGLTEAGSVRPLISGWDVAL